MKKVLFLSVLVLAVFYTVSASTPALAAYSSHQNDQDINNFLAVYPFARSTKLDDCSLCHSGSPDGKSGSCDYCHQTYHLQPPHGQVPLNPYGQAYRDKGRDQVLSGISKGWTQTETVTLTLWRSMPLLFRVISWIIPAWLLPRL
jgi:hypothetical protein